MKWIISVVLCTFFLPACLAADQADQKDEKPKPAQSIDELRQQLEKILKDTHTPGVSVAIVHKDGPEWVAGLGLSDVAANRATTADTLFRIGSTSKAFTSLSILLLRDQGKLSLDDPVHKLAPDLWFENRWESTDPIRVVHLLEHTTGWDDIHLREYAKQAPDSMSLRDGLDYDHHSRTSRWRPGTRMAYCNSGPPAAAYIVEKLTGQRLEDFVQQNLFAPIGMKTATYFEPASGTATTLYHPDGKTPFDYWHILMRPAGSINASANDMAAYVQFYLNRGAVGGKQIVPAADIDRMENPASTWAAKDGMKAGYGLSNYWTIADGFVYHGHDGGVDGGLTEMAYMADYGVGYFFSINSGSDDAFERVAKAIRAYITHKLEKPPVPAVASLPANADDYAGWYEPDSPRVEFVHFLERLAGLSWVHFKDGKLIRSSLRNRNDTYVPVTAAQFRHESKEEPPDPAPTLELLTPNPDGRFIQRDETTMKKLPTWLAITEILAVTFVTLCAASIVVYAPFWIIGGLFKSRRRPAERAMRRFPLLAVLSMVAFVATIILSGDDFIVRLGNLTGWSAALWAETLVFALASLASFLVALQGPGEGVRRGVRRFSLIVSVALLIATAYLTYWGIIGMRTWA
ncbi:MAG TPA: serine hydrolase domain-containing protein [Candidatus Dormibacteraeota bacterium]|nr:serine hydrolase domain-containing protein [Candidatus Dormibacteraeota bacterium]